MEFPNLGEHCSETSCNRLDFLPLRCDGCSAIFCTDHVSYTSHACPGAYKKDVQVPVCPLCDSPVPSRRGDPPDIAVGLHIDNECQSELKKKKIFNNRCSSKGCKVKEIVQVSCSDCHRNFCLRHRHPVDHNCIGKVERRVDNSEKNQTSKQTTKTTPPHRNGEVFRNLQGQMSEDEALARALQASMLEEVPSGHRCRLS